jgi:FkbM family methyltransferase
MTLSQTLKTLAARFGFHVVRNYQNPAHTLLGLGRTEFRTVLDVGANTGQFARAMSSNFPRATFHCFEPTPVAFEALSTWASTQQRIIPVQLALGEHAGILDMNLHTQHSTSSSLLATSAHCEALYPFTAAQATISVRVERLDDYVAALRAPLAGELLLKIDVQGYEAQVLRGAPRIVSQVRACIVEVSLDELYHGQTRFTDIASLMQAGNLEYAGNFEQTYGDDGRVVSLDAVFARRC